MSEYIRGTIINLNSFGATVRLEDGVLATAPQHEVERNRPAFNEAYQQKKPLDFICSPGGRHPIVLLAPKIRDEAFEDQIAAYLKMTHEWELPDAPPAHERHFLQKKRRAAVFRSRHATDR